MKRTPLKRKESIRDGFLRKLKREGTKIIFRRSGIGKRRPLKKVSRSQRHKLQQYYALRNEFLEQPENWNCQICTRRREAGENIPLNASTEVHHRSGRGRMMCEVREFIASCFPCRMWPHENPRLARELGLLV